MRLTGNLGVLGSSHTGSSGFFFFFVEVTLGKTLQNPCLVLVKPREDRNNVSCGSDMAEILLKAEKHNSVNLWKKRWGIIHIAQRKGGIIHICEALHQVKHYLVMDP